MSVYKFTRFGDELLPRYDPQRQLGPAPALPAVQSGFAGPFDARGGENTPPAVRMIEFTGTYIGDPDSVLVDESGAVLTDESDSTLTFDRSADIQVERLTRLIGETRRIERKRFADGALHYLAARLLAVDFQTRTRDGTRIATVSPRFETAQSAWHSAERSSVSGALDMSAAQISLEGVNSGLLAARQAVVTLTFSRRGASFSLFGAAGGRVWHWRLAFEESDPAAGAWQITAGPGFGISGPAGVSNPYTRFAVGDGHSVQPLIWLAPGLFRIEASEETDAASPGGGAVDLQIDFYEEYP